MVILIELPEPTYKRGSNALMSVNVYRNLHHHLLSKFKREYGEKILELLKDFDPITEPIKLTYELQFKGRKRIDIVNIGSMIDKVFSDCLVEAGLVKDDSVEFIHKVSFVGSNGWNNNRFFVRVECND